MTDYTDRLVDHFRSAVTASFELDQESISTLCSLLSDSVKEVGVPEAPRRRGTRKAPSKPRKKSAYNVFVAEQMKTDEVKALEPNQRMKHIGATWTAMEDDAKAPYSELADAANQEAAPAVAETA